MSDFLQESSRRIEATRVELLAKGYDPAAVAAELETCRHDAAYFTEPLSREISDQAFIDYLRQLLQGVEGKLAAVEAPADAIS